LFVGNSISSKIKENSLIQEIESIISANESHLAKLPNPSISPEFVLQASSSMKFIGKSNSKLNDPKLIFKCNIVGKETLCCLDEDKKNDNILINKLMQGTNSLDTLTDTFDSLKYVYRDDEEIKNDIINRINSSDTKPFVKTQGKSYHYIYKLVRVGNVNCILRMDKYQRYGRISS
jgi:hypothetical protein